MVWILLPLTAVFAWLSASCFKSARVPEFRATYGLYFFCLGLAFAVLAAMVAIPLLSDVAALVGYPSSAIPLAATEAAKLR